MRAKISNHLLRNVSLPLLLVVVENARRGIQIQRIGQQCGVRIVAKLAQILRVAQQIKITLDQLRVPQRLEALLIDCQPFANGALPIIHHRSGSHREYLIVGKLLAIVGYQLSGSGIFFLRNQKFQKMSIQRFLFRIASNPGAVLRDRDFFRKPLALNDTEDSLESSPTTLLDCWR